MIELATIVRNIHAEGGFEMRNWVSNSKAVLLALTGKCEQTDKYIEQPDECHEKVLGMWWSPGLDILRYFVKFPKEIFDESVIPTKRQILRVVMTIFDPLGLLGFFIIYAKILMQEIWRSGITWDEPIRQEELEKWWRWIGCLPFIEEIRIPRCYKSVSSAERIELHIFVDASKDAYAAAIYLRAIQNNKVACSLVASKTRVAPLKPISIPRLELMAAILGLRLANLVTSELSVRLDRRIFWSDSKNVLYWIRSDARKFQQFVAVRIGEILEDSHVQDWRWVSSSENVADDATKWSTYPDFNNASRWFIGPDFLSGPEEQWPKTDLNVASDNEHDLICHVDVKQPTSSPLAVISPDPMRFSKWEKLRGAQRYVLKFLRILWQKCKRPAKVVTLVEKSDMRSIEHVVIRNCQEEAYGEEIKQLHRGEPISRKSGIYTYSPYLDNFGMLRVKGRIDELRIADYDTRRPIILPRHHQVTYLIADSYHRKFHHHHNEIVVNEMRQRYSVSGLRALVRETAKKCQLCCNRRALPQPPEMAALPPERFATFSQAFTNTGIDYFGPFEIIIGRRREKRWGVLFTCLTVRAVHLEIATSLSTDSFLLVLKQFIARRGAPRCIWSDNGTNFRGASRILQNEIERFSTDELKHRYPEIEWHFIPPAAPHMGGCWERMVRSVKSVLMDILPTTGLREEVLRAAMADVEHILNSRPLTYVPLDSPEMEALTPNHLLVGSSSGIREHEAENGDGGTLSKNFRIACQLADQFWKRWIREYAPCLTRRSKWFQNPPNPIEVNDVVIIVDDNAKRNTWRKGIVIDVNCAKDGVVRSAVVRTADGLFTRPSVKLAKLDVRR
ncbi:PREDICTED: uncharacterized protein LOC108374345 [Rhagoletis zephyria]|uniref:uncharacterized protein LOC108374345 n=1 Tax=Rhagoletis zephyria TaxID=28612 RepID=UPI0008119FC8|nr:PREDICTED: uncharacterized protein LOC108374345 [Rhagoletis zephyria]